MAERLKNERWTVNRNSGGLYSTGSAQLTVLMDLRDELQALVRVFQCPNFQSIPRELRRIVRQIRLQRRCPHHPRYTGAQPPRVNCRDCRRYYKAVKR